MELTKEFFDERLQNLHKRMDDFPTSQELDTKLNQQTKEMKGYVHEAFEAQQDYIEARADEIIRMLDVRLAVQQLQLEMKKVKAAINIE